MWVIAASACRPAPTPPVAAEAASERAQAPSPVVADEPDATPKPAPEPAAAVWPEGAAPPQTACPDFLNWDEARAFEHCSVAEALFNWGALCPGGSTTCMRPCRTDVSFVDRDTPLANVLGYRYEGERLLEVTRDRLSGMGADGTVEAVDRYRYEDDRLVEVARYTPPTAKRPSSRSTFTYDGDGRVDAVTYELEFMVDFESVGLRVVRRTTFERDAKHRVVRRVAATFAEGEGHSSPREVVTEFTYTGWGGLKTADNGMYQWRWRYRGANPRPIAIDTRTGGDRWRPSHDLRWNDAGQIRLVRYQSTNEGDRFEYDELGRLVAEHPIPIDDLGRRIRRHVYDCE